MIKGHKALHHVQAMRYACRQRVLGWAQSSRRCASRGMAWRIRYSASRPPSHVSKAWPHTCVEPEPLLMLPLQQSGTALAV